MDLEFLREVQIKKVDLEIFIVLSDVIRMDAIIQGEYVE